MSLGMIGKYEKLDVLGSGATGIVYLARDTLMNRQVALKVMNLHSAEEQGVLEEARLLDRLRHPNIVRVHGVDRVDGMVLIDMELVRGQNLQQLLRREGSLSPKQAIRITRDVLNALLYAHGMHIVHRDIKPGNILIDQNGSARLADFGQADILATNAYAQGAGTFAYMAPEDFLPDARSDAQSDIWAVGVTLYEMLVGSRPYAATNVRSPFSWQDALKNYHEIELPKELQTQVPSLLKVLKRAMSHDKANRFANANEFLMALAPVEQETLLADPHWATANVQKYNDDYVSSVEGTVPAPLAHRVVPTSKASSGGIAHTAAVMPLQATSAHVVTKATAHVQLRITPSTLDFGKMHSGDTAIAQVRVKATRGRLSVPVEVIASDGSIVVSPPLFQEQHQTISVQCTALSEHEEGTHAHKITLTSCQTHAEIPIKMTVVPDRLRFADVALWYLPALVLAVLPTVTVGLSSPALGVTETGRLAPAAAALGLVFGLMLCAICFGIGTGLTERVIAGSAGAMMGGVLTTMQVIVDTAPRVHPSLTAGLQVSHWILVTMAALLLAQLMTFRWHSLWRIVYLGFALMANGTILALVYQPHR